MSKYICMRCRAPLDYDLGLCFNCLLIEGKIRKVSVLERIKYYIEDFVILIRKKFRITRKHDDR